MGYSGIERARARRLRRQQSALRFYHSADCAFPRRQSERAPPKHFGNIKIEELAKPYFCVSSDLTTGRDYIHRTGLLWRALRASVALPGILPPSRLKAATSWSTAA